MALWILSETTWVSRYQKKHSPTHTHHGHQSSLSASSIYYDPWHPPYSIHVLYSLFPQSLSKFSLVYLLPWHPPLHTPYISSPNHYLLFATRLYHRNLFCFSIKIMSSNPVLPLNSLLGTLSCNFTPHIHLCPLKCHLIFHSYRPGLTSMHLTALQQLLYNLPLTVNDIFLLVSNSTICLNLFHSNRILVSTAASASPSTLNNNLNQLKLQPFYAPWTLFGTTQVSWHQKGKTMQICTLTQTHNQARIPPLSCLRAGLIELD